MIVYYLWIQLPGSWSLGRRMLDAPAGKHGHPSSIGEEYPHDLESRVGAAWPGTHSFATSPV